MVTMSGSNRRSPHLDAFRAPELRMNGLLQLSAKATLAAVVSLCLTTPAASQFHKDPDMVTMTSATS